MQNYFKNMSHANYRCLASQKSQLEFAHPPAVPGLVHGL